MKTRPPPRSGNAKPSGDERASSKALDFNVYVPAYLTLLANKISSGASAIYRPKFGVGITEWRIVALLAVEPWIAAGRVCDVTGLDKAAVSRSLRDLAQRGLVDMEVDAADQRRQLIALTHKGVLLHDRMVDIAVERERQLLAALSTEEQAALIDFLQRLRSRLPAANAVRPKAGK
jgi:DNA-binding MarR family transcriptional regulator